MITINLLPEDIQEVYHKSRPQLLAIAGSAVLVLIAGIYFVVLHFVSLPSREKALNDIKQTRENLKPYETDHQDINSTITQFTQFEDAVKKCMAQQIVFSKKLYYLASIVEKQNTVEHNTCWLDNINIDPKTQAVAVGKAPTGATALEYSWTGSGACLKTELYTITKFGKGLQNHEDFGKEITYLNLPSPMVSPLTGYRESKNCYSFNIVMNTRYEAIDTKVQQPTVQQPGQPPAPPTHR